MKGTPSEKGVPFKWSKQKSVCGISVVKREIAVVFTTAISIFGGLEGDRTLDLCDANAALYQLSYEPVLPPDLFILARKLGFVKWHF